MSGNSRDETSKGRVGDRKVNMDTKSPEHTSFFIEIKDSLRHISVETKSMEDKLLELEEENAKLRELVRDAWGDGHQYKSCGDCKMMDECHAENEEAHKKGNGRWNTRCLFERRIEDRMRELGLEVG